MNVGTLPERPAGPLNSDLGANQHFLQKIIGRINLPKEARLGSSRDAFTEAKAVLPLLALLAAKFIEKLGSFLLLACEVLNA